MSKKSAVKKKSDSHPPKKNNYLSGSEFRNLGIIVIAGLILRIIFFLEVKNSPLSTILFSDSLIFSELAKSIIRNDNWFGDIVFYMSPGYTYSLAIIYSLFGEDSGPVRIMQILLNCANIIIIFYIAKELYSSRAGYAAAVIASIYSVFIFYSSVILLEVLFTFFISLMLYNLVRIKGERKSSSYWILTGLFLGIAALFRGNILLFLPFLVLWMFTKTFREYKKEAFAPVIYLILGVIIPILPVTINNYAAEKEFVLLTSNAGINFYIGNHSSATGIYKIPENIDLSLDPSGEKFAESETGKNMSSAEVSEFWFDRGSRYVASNPSEAFLLTVKKLFLFFDDHENPQSSIMDMNFYAKNYSFLLRLPLPGFYFIFLLAAAGIILSMNKDPKFTLIYYFIISYIISTIIFFVMGRFRVGIAPVFIVFAGFGLLKIYEIVRLGELKKLAATAIAVIILAAVNYFYLPVYSFSDYDAYLSLGNSYFQRQQYDEALKNYEKSLSLNPEAGTYVLIGNTLAVKKDVTGAFESYKKALGLNPANTLAHYNLGTLFVQTGRYSKAAQAFSAAIESDSTFADAYRNMAILYYMQEKYNESLLFFEKYLYLSNDEQGREMVKKDIEVIKRKLRN